MASAHRPTYRPSVGCAALALGDGCDEEALRIVRGLPRFSNSRQVPTELK